MVESGHFSRLCRSGTFLASTPSRVMNSSARSLPLRYARPGGMSRRVDRRFGASQARIARGEHQWVGLPTMHMTRIGGMEKVVRNGGAMTSAPVQTHHPPSTGGEGGGCSFKPNKYVANTCPASPDVRAFERGMGSMSTMHDVPCRPISVVRAACDRRAGWDSATDSAATLSLVAFALIQSGNDECRHRSW